jgi:structure-specific endonuclease subunit SLX1
MSVAFGRVKIVKKPIASSQIESNRPSEVCQICNKLIVDAKNDRLSCIDPTCRLVCHMLCLAERSLKHTIGHYVPIQSECPICENTFLWGDLIRKKNGCCDLENDADLLPDIAEISDDDDDDDDE